MEALIPETLLAWGRTHQGLVFALRIGSVVLFAGTLVAIPVVICRLPRDVYTRPRARRVFPAGVGLAVALVRNLAGLAIVAAGILMLVLPGQGILSIAIGLALVDFPGKGRLERRLLGDRRVFGAMNAIRRRFGRPPLDTPDGGARNPPAP